MKNNQEKWVNEVVESMKGSQRAKPAPELLGKITHQLFDQKAKVLSIRQWRIIAIAATLILALNILAISQLSSNNKAVNTQMAEKNSGQQDIISNYKLYE